jgi:hypothetical protein
MLDSPPGGELAPPHTSPILKCPTCEYSLADVFPYIAFRITKQKNEPNSLSIAFSFSYTRNTKQNVKCKIHTSKFHQFKKATNSTVDPQLTNLQMYKPRTPNFLHPTEVQTTMYIAMYTDSTEDSSPLSLSNGPKLHHQNAIPLHYH